MQEFETITAIERIVIVGFIVLNMNDVRGVSNPNANSSYQKRKQDNHHKWLGTVLLSWGTFVFALFFATLVGSMASQAGGFQAFEARHPSRFSYINNCPVALHSS